MIKVNLYKYYSFGFNYYILLNNSSSKTHADFFYDLTQYIDFINELDLTVTKSCLRMKGLPELYEQLEKTTRGKNKNEIVDSDLYDKIITILDKTDTTLDAELDIKNAYLTENKRVSNDHLISKIQRIFAKNVYIELPEIAQYDFSEAGKCLVFDRYTACAFHSLRGTEAVLKFFYEKILKKTALDTQTWGNFHQEIEANIKNKNISPKPDDELMINLNSLRMYYRNRTQHPQLIYTSDGVQDLLFLCIKTVNEMVNDLIDRKAIDPLPF